MICQMSEVWVSVRGYESLYEVSDYGRIRSLDRHVPWRYRGELRTAFWRGQELNPWVTDTGYLMVNLSGTTRTLHSVVADAFLGPRPEGKQVAHADGDRTNPRLANLRYATQKENEADKRTHGTLLLGADSPNSKLSEEDVRSIRTLIGTITQREIATMFGITQPNVAAIKSGRSWGHLK